MLSNLLLILFFGVVSATKIEIVTIICGEQKSLLNVWISSILISHKQSLGNLRVTVFTDSMEFISPCLNKLSMLLDINFKLLSDHVNDDLEELAKTDHRFKCAIYKLNLPAMMINESRVIFTDVDTLFLEDISILSHPNMSKKMIWATPEYNGESTTVLKNWYQDISRKQHYFPPNGINTGVLLLNLDAMRKENVTALNILRSNTEEVVLADQDFLNSWAHFNQEEVGLLSCKWNIRLRSNCPTYLKDVAVELPESGIFHGNNKLFQRKDKIHLLRLYSEHFDSFCRKKPGISFLENFYLIRNLRSSYPRF
jgi:Glycosyl transferase family 8